MSIQKGYEYIQVFENDFIKMKSNQKCVSPCEKCSWFHVCFSIGPWFVYLINVDLIKAWKQLGVWLVLNKCFQHLKKSLVGRGSMIWIWLSIDGLIQIIHSLLFIYCLEKSNNQGIFPYNICFDIQKSLFIRCTSLSYH